MCLITNTLRQSKHLLVSLKICACTRDVPNNEHFASVEALAGQLETVAKLCPSLLIVVCDTLALGLAATAALPCTTGEFCLKCI